MDHWRLLVTIRYVVYVFYLYSIVTTATVSVVWSLTGTTVTDTTLYMFHTVNGCIMRVYWFYSLLSFSVVHSSSFFLAFITVAVVTMVGVLPQYHGYNVARMSVVWSLTGTTVTGTTLYMFHTVNGCIMRVYWFYSLLRSTFQGAHGQWHQFLETPT